MSTIYQVELVSAAGGSVQIEIERTAIPLPLEDLWRTDNSSALAANGGKIFAWGASNLQLASSHGLASILLEGFRKSTVSGDEGDGLKSYPDGTIPMGDLHWKCISVD